MAGWSLASGGSSAPSVAMTAPAGKQAVLKGIMAVPIVNASAALLEIHGGPNANTLSTIVVGYSTGPIISLRSPDGLLKAPYISADMTTNFTSTFANILIWGEYE